jgi:hypothetical protein
VSPLLLIATETSSSTSPSSSPSAATAFPPDDLRSLRALSPFPSEQQQHTPTNPPVSPNPSLPSPLTNPKLSIIIPNKKPSPPEETVNNTPSKAQKELLLSLLLKLRCMHKVERKLSNNNSNSSSSSSKTSVIRLQFELLMC